MPHPLRPYASNYDLHEMAGGLPLRAFAAPNVHLMSKHRREVCNPTGKSNIPINKCGSKRTALRTKQEACLFLVFLCVKLVHNQIVYSLQLRFVFNGAQNGFVLVFLDGLENTNL